MEMLEKINGIGSLLLLLCGYVIIWQLRKIKLGRNRTKFENLVFFIANVGAILYAVSYLMMTLEIGL